MKLKTDPITIIVLGIIILTGSHFACFKWGQHEASIDNVTNEITQNQYQAQGQTMSYYNIVTENSNLNFVVTNLFDFSISNSTTN